MDDLISRRAAIDALAAYMPSLTTADGSVPVDHDIFVAQETCVDCIQIIHELPSAQPQKCSDILEELKDDDYYNYIHTGHSRFSEDDWDYIIHNAKEKEKLHERLNKQTGGY